MELFKEILKAIKHRFIRYLNKERFVHISLEFPIISFTFDDFPSSAYRIARPILKKYNICATYYACFGLMDKIWGGVQQFSIDDLRGLTADDHEIGGHTFNHINAERFSCREYEMNILKDKEKAKELLGYELKNFSYPYGKGSYNLKKIIFKHFRSLRGILPGINVGWTDLGELRCNRLYSNSVDLSYIKELIEENKIINGWLIFYTHDVCDDPSPCGCTPDFLEKVLELSIEFRSKILTVNQALDYILPQEKQCLNV